MPEQSPREQSHRPLHDPAKLSPLKWLVGVGVFSAVVLVCGGIGVWLSGPSGGVPAGAPAGALLVAAVLGTILAVIGGALYELVLLTRCFTFDFSRPFFPSYKYKLWVANLVVGLFLQAGFALLAATLLGRPLLRVLPPTAAAGVAFFGPFLLLNLLLIWLSLWAPLETALVDRRLRALGIPPQVLACGTCVGVSDPTRSSFKKILVEDDLGVLWLTPFALVYRGDSTAWEFAREQVVAIEREADAGSTSAYFGAVAVILRVVDLEPTGQPPRANIRGRPRDRSDACGSTPRATGPSPRRRGA